MLNREYKSWNNQKLSKLLDYYDLFPFHQHPLWQAILKKELSYEQVIKAEAQHYLRTKAGQPLRKEAMEKSIEISESLWMSIIETYIEECTDNDGTPTHLDLVKRILFAGGMDERMMQELNNTPGNISAIALYKDIASRGAGCHIVGAGMVEYFYSQLSPKIFNSYTKQYGFSEFAVETYSLHGVMDQTHAQRAFSIVNELDLYYESNIIEQSVRDAFVATSLHYDGMLQAATGQYNYWNGKN